MVTLLKTALPVFLALALGMLCRSKGFLNREGVDTLKKVVVNLTLPAVLLNAFATAEYSLSTMAMPVLMFLLCCLALALGMLAVRLFGIKSRLVPFLMSGCEAGMLGYALFVMLFPDKSISGFAMLDLGQTLFVFTLYKILISGKREWKIIVSDMIHSPVLWAVFAGVLLGATGLYRAMGQLRDVLKSVTDFISAPTGMIILLTVGFDLVMDQIPWKKVGGLIGIRLGIMAICFAVAVLLNRTVLQGLIFEGAALLMVILPPPYVIPVFADEPDERVQISSSLSAMTLVTMVLFGVLSLAISMI
jgi:predicted permease